MKRIASTIFVAIALFGAAIYYASVSADTAQTKPAPPAKSSSAPEPPPSPTTHAEAPGTLTLEAESSHGYLPEGEQESLYAAIDVTAGDFEGGERPPLNLAVVLDRSGSMGGEKLEYAKEAAHTIVDKLGADDHLSLVTYHSNATVKIHSAAASDGTKRRMHTAIRRIRDAGGTNIGEAMRAGFAELRDSQTDSTINRMILLSDGKPTVGISDPAHLAANSERVLEQGVSVTTMGVGLDYNEDLMTDVANRGGGNYYFIDAPQKVVSIFEKELSGLGETVAKSASLVVDVGESVELESVRGYPAETSDGRVTVSLSEFFAEQNKSVLLKMTGEFSSAEPEPVVDVELSYDDLESDRPTHQSATLTALSSAKPAKVEASINKSVISRVQQVEVAKALETAMSEYEKGNEKEARRVLRRRQQKLEEAQKSYDLSDKKVDPFEGELESASDSVGSAAPSSSRGKQIIKSNKEKGNLMKLDSTRK